jgi:hypothetical protein
MAIWRLIPIDLADPSWVGSSHRGPVLVRARDEALARETAQAAFGAATRFVPGKGVPIPPWTRPQLVRAERIEHPFYPDEGPAEVLEPSFEANLVPEEKPGQGQAE